MLVRAILEVDRYSKKLLYNRSKKKYVNDYIIKEVRRVLSEYYEYSVFEIEKAIEVIKEHCRILPTSPKAMFKKLDIRDKSDKPVVQSAIVQNCVLVIYNTETYVDAKKYVITKTPEEVYTKKGKKSMHTFFPFMLVAALSSKLLLYLQQLV